MDLFVCDVCGCVDHADLVPPLNGTGFVCSEHHPNSKKWHGQFPKEQYDPKKHPMVANRISGIGFS